MYLYITFIYIGYLGCDMSMDSSSELYQILNMNDQNTLEFIGDLNLTKLKRFSYGLTRHMSYDCDAVVLGYSMKNLMKAWYGTVKDAISLFDETGTSRTVCNSFTKYQGLTPTDKAKTHHFYRVGMSVSSTGDRLNASIYVRQIPHKRFDKLKTTGIATLCSSKNVEIWIVGIALDIDVDIAYRPEYFMMTKYSELNTPLQNLITVSVKCSKEQSLVRTFLLTLSKTIWYSNINVGILVVCGLHFVKSRKINFQNKRMENSANGDKNNYSKTGVCEMCVDKNLPSHHCETCNLIICSRCRLIHKRVWTLMDHEIANLANFAFYQK